MSQHLSRLTKIGLVSAKSVQYYNVYSLNTDTIQTTAQRMLKSEELPKLAQDIDRTAYDRKVLDTFVEADGTIKAFPAQEKKFQVLLRYVEEAFERGKRYSEKQVNHILSRYNKDSATLRRSLIEDALMAREGGAGRTGASGNRLPAAGDRVSFSSAVDCR